MASTWGQWLEKKLEGLGVAPDELDDACREARDFASHFGVSYGIFLFIMKVAKPARVFSVYLRRWWLCLLGSRVKTYTFQGSHRSFVGDSAFHTCFRRANLLLVDTAEVVSPSASRTEFDSI